MKHDYNVGPNFEGFVITRFLVPAVAFVLLVNNNVMNFKLFSHFNSVIPAAVVNQDHLVNNGEIDLVVSYFECFGSVVGRKNHHHLFVVDHVFCFSSLKNNKKTN